LWSPFDTPTLFLPLDASKIHHLSSSIIVAMLGTQKMVPRGVCLVGYVDMSDERMYVHDCFKINEQHAWEQRFCLLQTIAFPSVLVSRVAFIVCKNIHEQRMHQHFLRMYEVVIRGQAFLDEITGPLEDQHEEDGLETKTKAVDPLE
jgi:hypothetical protein